MSGVNADALAETVDLIYEAALRPELWRSVLNRLTGALGSDSAGIFAHPDPSLQCTVWSEGNEVVDWFLREGWHLNNPRPARAIRVLRMMRAGTEAELFTPWELDHLPFNAELQLQGYRWDAGAIIGTLGENAVLFTTQRRSRRERFGRAELDAIEALATHLARAVQMTARLGIARGEGMLDALEGMACAAILLDYMGRPCRLNARAERLLGRVVNVAGGRLGAADKSADAALQRLIGDILAQGGLEARRMPVAAALPRALGRPLVAYGIPVVRSAHDVLQQARAVLIIIDLDEHREPADVALQQAFGLTRAEIRIARGLARGEDLRQIAEREGISIATARAQLKSVMAKSDTHRQSQLVSVLARLSMVTDASDGGARSHHAAKPSRA